MADDKRDLADRVKLTATQNGEELISLYGTGRQVFQRVLQTLSGMQDVSGVSIGCNRAFTLGGVLIDATRAPFRVNGRRWSAGFNLAATAALFNVVRMQNRPSQQPKEGLVLLTVESVEYQGPAPMAIRPIYVTGISELDAGPAIDGESPIGTAQSGLGKNAFGVIGMLATTAGAIGSATPTAMLANIATGNAPHIHRPDGLVVWPAEILDFIQQIINVAMVLTVGGKVWTFSQTPA